MKRASTQGFALIEVLVAAAILAGVVGLLMGTVSTQAGAERRVDERRAALLVAQSALEQGGIAGTGLAREGSDERFEWQVDVRPEAPGSPAVGLERVTVSVRVRGNDRPILTLSTLRLGR